MSLHHQSSCQSHNKNQNEIVFYNVMLRRHRSSLREFTVFLLLFGVRNLRVLILTRYIANNARVLRNMQQAHRKTPLRIMMRFRLFEQHVTLQRHDFARLVKHRARASPSSTLPRPECASRKDNRLCLSRCRYHLDPRGRE